MRARDLIVSAPTLHPSEIQQSANSTLARSRRVVHVALGTNVGGMEKLLVEFAKHHNGDRFETTFISLQTRGQLAVELERHGSKVIDFHKQDGWQPSLVFRLAKRLRGLRADVVHTHNTAAMVYGVTAAKLAGVKTIIHTRHGQRLNATARQTTIFRWLSKACHRVVSVCEDGTRLTMEDGVPADRAVTICNGIDLTRFENTGPSRTGPITVVARLSAEKDVATLIHAVKIAMGASKRFRLRIIGDGVERENLESLSRSLELENVVEFMGQQSEVAELLGEASMFVLPSLTEGISLTLLEAMARGLPVVATRVGGTPEVVVDGETGWLVCPGDAVALADAMIDLHTHPEAASEMGRRGRERVEQRFTIGRMVRGYERLYDWESNQ